MQIIVNGRPQATDARTLHDLCAALGFAGARVATAVNGDFVASEARGKRTLQDDDRIEIVAPRQGG